MFCEDGGQPSSPVENEGQQQIISDKKTVLQAVGEASWGPLNSLTRGKSSCREWREDIAKTSTATRSEGE